MSTNEIICTCRPNYIETLRRIPVGEERTYNLTGRRYAAIMTARSRLQSKEGRAYRCEFCEETNTVKITRTA